MEGKHILIGGVAIVGIGGLVYYLSKETPEEKTTRERKKVTKEFLMLLPSVALKGKPKTPFKLVMKKDTQIQPMQSSPKKKDTLKESIKDSQEDINRYFAYIENNENFNLVKSKIENENYIPTFLYARSAMFFFGCYNYKLNHEFGRSVQILPGMYSLDDPYKKVAVKLIKMLRNKYKNWPNFIFKKLNEHTNQQEFDNIVNLYTRTV